jgi:hypothetical protein
LDKLLDEFLAPKVGKEVNIKKQGCRPTGYDVEPPLDFYLWGPLRTAVQLTLIKAEDTLKHRIFYACQTIPTAPEPLI